MLMWDMPNVSARIELPDGARLVDGELTWQGALKADAPVQCESRRVASPSLTCFQDLTTTMGGNILIARPPCLSRNLPPLPRTRMQTACGVPSARRRLAGPSG